MLLIGQVLGQGHGEETVSVSSLYHHIPQPSDTDLYIDTDRDVDLVSARWVLIGRAYSVLIRLL